MLQIRNIRKTYSTGKIRVEALKGINIDIKKKINYNEGDEAI